MTKKWVKEELKKNPVENIIVGLIDYFNKSKNNILAGLIVVVIIGLFIGAIIKNRIKENRNASKLLAFAQNDFDRFNYEAAIKKFNEIERNFRSSPIMHQVLYFKGLSYYRQGKLQQAEKELKKCISEFKKNKIVSEGRLSLAAVYEDMEKYEEALTQYEAIKDNEYLKPEALTGAARLYELMGKKEDAVNTYNKIQSHYINTYWGNFAKSRLSALGVKPKQSEEFSPEINLE